jgi:hypothetical protein
VRHETAASFWKKYGELPSFVQGLADKQFELLVENPAHPSLQFKKVGKYWSARVTDSYRAVAFKQGDDFVWFWIGSHADYERLIR